MSRQLSNLATEKNFKWSISPANSPWRQGSSEVRIKNLKRLLQISVGSVKLTPTELQTFLFEAANLTNERPIGVGKSPRADGTFNVLTPNKLLMGRSTNSVPDDARLSSHLKHVDRYQLIQQATQEFWTKWTQQVTPEKVIRQRWHETGRNVKPGDVVLLHDKTAIKGKYKLGIVSSVKRSLDKLVRSCTVTYTIPFGRDPAGRYTEGRKISVTRSIQRLTVLLPVEEQDKKLCAYEDTIRESSDVSEDLGAENLVAEDLAAENLEAEERTDIME